MSLTTIEKHTYEAPLAHTGSPFFEVQAIRLETACIANQNYQSEYYKVFLIEEGTGTYQIDFQEFSIEGGGLFCLSPGQVLTVKSEKLHSGFQLAFNREFYCVETQGKAIACNSVLFNNVHRATFLELDPAGVQSFKILFTTLIDELKVPGDAHLSFLETYVRLILIQTLRGMGHVTESEQSEEVKLVRDFINLVDQNFTTLHAVSEYAERLFVTPKSLSKRLNLQGYPTPTNMIRNRVVLQAKRDLRYTDKPIKSIAFDLGFDDPAYFTRVFKKSEAQSPQQYRDQFQSLLDINR